MSTDTDYDFLFKLVIVGDSNVGKTQILSRFIDDQFVINSKPTVGVQFGTKTIKVGNVAVKNQIWDTAGQEKFRALTCAYYRGAIGAIVVFDLSKYSTFQHIERWLREVRQYSKPQVSILLVGNKSDLPEHHVRQEEIQNYAAEQKLMYLSTSAATGENIELAFKALIQQILGHSPQIEQDIVFSDQQENNNQVDQVDNEKSTGNNKSKATTSNMSFEQKPKIVKRQRPRIEAFSIQQTPKKVKIDDHSFKNDKNKKNCC